MNKGGFSKQIITVIIMGLVFGGLMIFLFLLSLGGPIITSTFNEVTTIVQDVASDIDNGPQTPGVANATQAVDASVVKANESIQQLEWIIYTLFLILFLIFIVMCFYVRTYPFLIFVWIFLMVIIIFISLFLTVVYQDISTGDAYLSGIYESWETNHFLLSNLPHIMTAIGIAGGSIMFMLLRKDKEAESLTL